VKKTLFALLVFAAATSIVRAQPSPDAGAPARAEIAPKVAAARAILDKWQANEPQRAQRKLHIVYWTPADREPAPQHRERLSKILEDIRTFYANEMQRLGFGRRTFELDHTADGLVKIHLARGAKPYAEYKVESGSEIRRDCVPSLKNAGVEADKETIVIFCNMANWDAEKRTINQNSPYYAGGSPRSGTAWQVDSPILNLDGLTETVERVTDGQYKNITLGRYNSIFIGGIAHELGHALSLPHCRERPDERAAFGTALMGSGNRTYGEDRRKDGPGSFLTLTHALRLASHPLFCGSVKGIADAPSVQPAELAIAPKDKGFVFTGRAVADPPVYAVLAYTDPEGGGDYDATTATAVPDAEGRFSLDCQALTPGKSGELRIVFLQANGVPSGSMSGTPFRYAYKVAADGKVDISTAQFSLLAAPLIAAVNAKNATQAQAELAKLRQNTALDARLIKIAERFASTLSPAKLIAPADVPRENKSVSLCDLIAARQSVGWGQSVRDRLPDPGAFLLAGGNLYERGFYAHAVSVYEWKLDGSWKSLSGEAGLADGNDGSVQAIIEGDGKTLWQSPILKGGKAVPFNVSIEGVQTLTLKFSDAGDTNRSDWGVWLEPVLSR
jgi:hypothetical protein